LADEGEEEEEVVGVDMRRSGQLSGVSGNEASVGSPVIRSE